MLIDPRDWTAYLESLVFSKLEEREAVSLELPFTKEEIVSVLRKLNGEKALKPDGYITAFWQFSWDIVKDEVMAVFRDFFMIGKFVKILNSTFLVMVPKNEGIDDFKDFRPISLVGNLYKMIAKVLANRLKKVMGVWLTKPITLLWKAGRSSMPP